MSGSVYFFRRCASKSPFGILRTPFFSPSKNFLENLNRFFFEIAPSFSFLLSTLPSVFCSCNDKDLFLNFGQLLLHKLTLIWHFFQPLLKKPLLYSKPALFSLSSIGCSYVFFSFWTSSAPKCSRQTAGIVLVKECSFTPIDPLKLFRRIKDTSSSRTFYLSSFALGQLMQIGFPFTLGALG